MSRVAYSPEVIVIGEVVQPRVRGSRIDAKVVPGGTLWDQMLPRPWVQPGCNHALFSVGCGLLKSDWQFTATVSDPGVAGYPFEFEISSLARTTGPTPDYFADWFSGGWVEFGTGRQLCRRPILRSTNPVAGVLVITLSGDPLVFPSVSDAVVLYPGCDGRMESCKAFDGGTNPEGKFDNFLNFGGHPFVPVANPTLIKNATGASGGKK